MKNLYLIRHAKSDQTFFGNDFERPLNQRGKADAPAMANRLIAKNIIPNAIISSPALRAKTTAIYFAEAYNLDPNNIAYLSALYHANEYTLRDIVLQLPDAAETIFLFTHNMGITYFANMLTKDSIDDIPTCGIFGVQANVENWSHFMHQKNDLLLFDYPKNG
jgi:phosphohistidine phosphatase